MERRKRSPLGPAIRREIDQRWKERQKSPAFLESSRIFNDSIRLPEDKEPVLQSILQDLTAGERIYKVEQKKHDLSAILANLIIKKRRPVSVSLNVNFYNNNRYLNGVSVYTTILIKKLEELGLIRTKKGVHDEKNPHRNRQTRIWADKKLIELLKPLPDRVTQLPAKELVELKTKFKRDKTGKIQKDKAGKPIKHKKPQLMDYKDTAFTRSLRKNLKTINRINTKAEIVLISNDDVLPVQTDVKAVFSEDFKHHGRLYTSGHYRYQEYPETERIKITINDDPVAELDYGQLHPRLLYAQEGIQFPLDQDCYSIVSPKKKLRPFLKIMLLAMLNSETYTQAEKACNYHLYMSETDYGISKAKPLMLKFMETHEPISKYLCCGSTGLKIMNLDAKIALDVCMHFAKKNVSILPIHDSFIVQKQYHNELFKIMDLTYQKYTGGFHCPIK